MLQRNYGCGLLKVIYYFVRSSFIIASNVMYIIPAKNLIKIVRATVLCLLGNQKFSVSCQRRPQSQSQANKLHVYIRHVIRLYAIEAKYLSLLYSAYAAHQISIQREQKLWLGKSYIAFGVRKTLCERPKKILTPDENCLLRTFRRKFNHRSSAYYAQLRLQFFMLINICKYIQGVLG